MKNKNKSNKTLNSQQVDCEKEKKELDIKLDKILNNIKNKAEKLSSISRPA